MIEIKEKENCCACHACYNICPKGAISMEEDDKGFKYPVVKQEMCINCGICEKVCPILNRNSEKRNDIKAYACFNKDEQIRKKSSSGGIFQLLANNILNKNGIVVGASLNQDFLAEHLAIEKQNDLEKLMGSKYIQSDIKNTYKETKENLEKGKYVLFTGTPCQVEGLKAYLNKEYDNLYTQDLICHGVSSKKVWTKYIKFMEKMQKEKTLEIEFRNKTYGWKEFATYFKYENKRNIIKHNDDMFMKTFLNNLSLRDSCYNCKFKKRNRISDITLADFWGIDNISPDMNDDKGTSLVIINSKKGLDIFDEIKENIVYKEVDFEEAIKYNKSMYESSSKPKNREEFFASVDKEEDFKRIIKKFVPSNNIFAKVKRKMIEKIK